MTDIRTVQAIDVHGHFGEYDVADADDLKRQFMSGDAETVVARAKAAGTSHTVVSPLGGLMPRGQAGVVAANEETERVVDNTDGLLQWVVVHPLLPETFEQARRMLSRPKCMGIKIHPEEHCYEIAEHGAAIFDFAAGLDAIVLTHSGEANSLPADYVPFADNSPNVTLILAHMGHGVTGDGPGGNPLDLQVRAIQASKHGNIYTDTSSMKSLLPGLLEWAVGEVGAGHILYGTDTPLYFAPAQRARIDQAELEDEQKQVILRDNARRLLAVGGEEDRG